MCLSYVVTLRGVFDGRVTESMCLCDTSVLHKKGETHIKIQCLFVDFVQKVNVSLHGFGIIGSFTMCF